MFSAQQPAASMAVFRVRRALRMPMRCLSGIELMICSVRCRISTSSDFRVRRPSAVIRTVAARPSDCAPRTRSTNPRASSLSRTRVMALGVMPDRAARSVSRVPSLETRIRRIAVCLWLSPSQQTSSGPTWPRMRPTLSRVHPTTVAQRRVCWSSSQREDYLNIIACVKQLYFYKKRPPYGRLHALRSFGEGLPNAVSYRVTENRCPQGQLSFRWVLNLDFPFTLLRRVMPTDLTHWVSFTVTGVAYGWIRAVSHTTTAAALVHATYNVALWLSATF